MMLLTTRLRIDPDGKPHIPGNLEIWKSLFARSTLGKYDVRLRARRRRGRTPDDLLEALFALCRKNAENQPLKIFMAVSDVDRNRARAARTGHRGPPGPRLPGVPGAIRHLQANRPRLPASPWLRFSMRPAAISRTPAATQRADTTGMFQALVGLWQILVRQEDIPEDRADSAFAGVVALFPQVRDNRSLFDAGVKGLDLLLAAAGASAGGAAPREPQEAC